MTNWVASRLVLAASVVFVIAVRPATPETPPKPPVFPGSVDLVRLDVTAVGKDGAPVTDLGPSDFEVSEKGTPREVVTCELILVKPAAARAPASSQEPPRVSTPAVLEPDEGRYFLLFFDDWHISSPVSEQVRKRLLPLLEREAREGDWVSVVAPEKRIWWTARTPWEHRQIPALVRKLGGQFVRDPVGTGAECKPRPPVPAYAIDFNAMRVVEYGSPTGAESASRGGTEGGATSEWMMCQAQYDVAQQRLRRSLAALQEAIQSMAGWRGRKSLFLISEGFIRPPRLQTLFDAVIAAARQSGVTVHFIAAQGLDPTTCPNQICLDTEAGGVSYIAVETGGKAFLTNDVSAPVAEVLERASAYYLLGILPLGDRPGEHRVKVRVRRRGVSVVARNRYYVAAEGGTQAPNPGRALRAAFDATGIPIEVTMQPAEKPASVDLVIALPPDNQRDRRLTLFVECRPLEGGTVVQDAAEITLPATSETRSVSRRLELSPGVWQARVVVTDEDSGAAGSVRHTFELPPAER